MQIRFKDIPIGLPCKVDGYDAVKLDDNIASVVYYPKAPSRKARAPKRVFVYARRLCEISDMLADEKGLGPLGVPPRPLSDEARQANELQQKRREEAGELLKRALTDPINKLFDLE